MLKKALPAIVSAFFFCAAAHAATIVTREEDKYFFQKNRMDRYEGQYEHTYFFDPEKSVLTRTRIYDYHTKKITPDETHFKIQRQLNSDPMNAIRFGLPAVIRAIAQPDPDTIEIIVIRDDSVQTTTSQGSRIVVSNARRLK